MFLLADVAKVCPGRGVGQAAGSCQHEILLTVTKTCEVKNREI